MSELATSAEVLAGVDDERAVTPKGLSDWSKTPVGAIVTYPVDSIPSHCLECNGATISRETYPELFWHATYGEGDGSTTFQLPDLRGEFIEVGIMKRDRCFEGNGSAQADHLPSHTSGTQCSALISGSTADISTPAHTINTARMAGGTETPDPRNVAMMFCIVYE